MAYTLSEHLIKLAKRAGRGLVRDGVTPALVAFSRVTASLHTDEVEPRVELPPGEKAGALRLDREPLRADQSAV